MNVTISSNKALDKLIDKFPKAVKMGLAAAAADHAATMKYRSGRGYGLKGVFKPYSASYAAFRQKKGRQTSPVNHHFTGRMLASVQSKASRSKGTIFFSSSAEKKKGAWTHALRPWWGVASKEQALIDASFSSGLKRGLK